MLTQIVTDMMLTVYPSTVVAARKANITVNAFIPESIVAPPTMMDACSLGVKCPILQNIRNVFKAPIPVRTQYVPPTDVAFSFKMRDGNGPMILCFKIMLTVAK